MALSADTPRAFELGTIQELPVKASTKIYEGAAVGDVSGYMRGLVAGDRFAGFAERQADNSATATDGYINVRVRASGKVQLTISGVAVTDVGNAVYASADGTFTLTEESNSFIGHVDRYVTTDTAVVAFYTNADIAASVSTATSTAKSIGDSKATSLSTLCSTADSKAVSNSVIESTNKSIAASAAVSNSTIISKNLSTGNSKDTSQSVLISTLDSKVASYHA